MSDLYLKEHQKRVIEENAQLSERLGALYAFFQGPVFPTLSEAEQSRLRNQARFMDGYAAVLEERIVAFRKEAAEARSKAFDSLPDDYEAPR